jgi:hypothetical protein
MSAREKLEKLLENMPEDRLREIVDFAAFLSGREERADWRQFGQMQIGRAYGADEPEYTLADLRPENKP